MRNHIAIIDMGSNTFHLLIKGVDAFGSGFDLFSKQSHVRIAEGGLIGNKILPIAQSRAIKTLREFKGLIEELGVDQVVAFATSAFRDATNTGELLEKGSKILESDIEIISGQREAELIFKGVTKAYEPNNKPYLVVDIGGGSVEFIIGLKHNILWSQSLPIGGHRLTNAFHKSHPISRADKTELQDYLQKQLEELNVAISQYRPKAIVGAAGVFETLSKIEHVSLKNKTFPEFAKAIQINLNSVSEISQLIKRSDRSALFEIPGMHDFRAEQMPVSVILIEEVLKLGNLKELWYSNYSMKEGVFYEYLESTF